MIVLSVIAPGQEEVLLKEISSLKTDVGPGDHITHQLKEAYYATSDKRTQLQILSLFVKNYTKQQLLQMIPSLTSSKIDAARKHASLTGPGQILNPPKIFRIRLTRPKLLHFLEYVSMPSISQVLGFGCTYLHLSNGEKVQVPKVIRNAVNARIIDSYQSYCKESNIQTFSRASLYRILKACRATKKKAMHGLDNTTALGMSAMETLLKTVTRLTEYGLDTDAKQNLIETINICNQHLKFDAKSHFAQSSSCGSHCSTHALSDPLEKCFSSTCEHSHTDLCSTCNIADTVGSLVSEAGRTLRIPSKEITEEIQHEIDVAAKYIKDWKAHLLRTVHQDLARQNILQNLKPHQGLLIMDWAMKFLPLQFRETQSDFFGKRGISWHISCLVTNQNADFQSVPSLSESTDQLDLNTFIHVLEKGKQGWFSVAHIICHLLDVIKKQFPPLQEVFIKTDNAGCYHSIPIISFISQNNENFPIRVLQYNFSEAQSGKDLCDSKTGSCRMHIARYLNEGNDIVTALDLKKALDSN